MSIKECNMAIKKYSEDLDNMSHVATAAKNILNNIKNTVDI